MAVNPEHAAVQTLSARIDALETRITYQDDIIEQLNAVILAQWGKLDQATALIARLDARLNDAQDNPAGADTFNNQRPPHW